MDVPASKPLVAQQTTYPVTTSVRLAQSLDVLDKQYRLYSWNDSKALSLITTDSVLFAALGFLFAACLPDRLALLLLVSALAAISLSLMVVLRQVIPQGSSGRSGETPNVRSLRGICSFSDWEAYRTHFCSCSEEQFAEDAIRQAYGMANNNDNSRTTIRQGVTLTMLGIVFLVAAAIAASLSARDFHLLGTWAVPASQGQQSGAPPSPVGKTDTMPRNGVLQKGAQTDQPPTLVKH